MLHPRSFVTILALLLAATAHADVLLEENFESLAPSLQSAADEGVDASIKGWTHTPPKGWTIDNTRMDTSSGIQEWAGWTFTTVPFWDGAGQQNRTDFTLAENVFAVADSDEFDDKPGAKPFDSTLVSPKLTVRKRKPVYVSWDNICRAIPIGRTQFIVSIDGGPDQVIKVYQHLTLSNVRESVELMPPEGRGAWTLVLKWREAGKNVWFWVIDNILVTHEPPEPEDPLTPLAKEHDWPTYRKDIRRSGVTEAKLSGALHEDWRYQPRHAPAPAWPGPATEDVSHGHRDLSPTNTYDRAFHVAVVKGRVYFGSSSEDAVFCLDLDNGEVVWTYPTEGPVRVTPTVTNGRVYVGSDDGCAYCLDAHDGALHWKRRIGPEDRRLPGNQRIISLWPVRSGVAVDGDTAYCSAGLFPNQGVYLAALDARSGEPRWTQAIDISSQGDMLATPTRLFLQTGRTAPVTFARDDGRKLGACNGLGGAFAVVVEDLVVHGPSEQGDIHISAPNTLEKIVATPGVAVVVNGDMVYTLRQDALTALNRTEYIRLSRLIAAIEAVKPQERTEEQKSQFLDLLKQRKACTTWTVPCDAPYSFILAGDTLLAGGEGAVNAFDADDGTALWTLPVNGRAYGLAVSRGRLLVSTDTGAIHCFKRWRGRGRQVTPATKPFPISPNVREIAEKAFGATRGAQGYSLVFGADPIAVVGALVDASDMHVIAVAHDDREALAIRRQLLDAGLLGVRATVHAVDGDALPYGDYVANLVLVSTEEFGHAPTVPASEIARVLRPSGGVLTAFGNTGALTAWANDALFNWTSGDVLPMVTALRDALPGAGEWTHTYAEPGNTACSGDVLVGSPVALQWFGRPGPRRMVDRHFRNVPPLYKDGRLFIPGNEVVYTLDAYNGALLWQRDLPGARRLGVFLDPSNMVVCGKSLYVAAGRSCRRFDVATGDVTHEYPLAQPIDGDIEHYEWGYLACVDGALFGTIRPEGATYQTLTNEAQFSVQSLWYPNMKMALSESLFALDVQTGTPRWHYVHGRIIDNTVTIASGTVFFVETQSPKALADTTGRLTMWDIGEGGERYLTALDAATGAVRFRSPVDMTEIQQVCFLSHAHGTLLLSGGKLVNGDHVRIPGQAAKADLQKGGGPLRYHLYAFDAGTGKLRWDHGHDTKLNVDGGHGEYNRHPTIIGKVVYSWPNAYDIETGAQLDGWAFDRRGHGCGGVSAGAHTLFWRGHNPWMYDLRPDGGPLRITQVSRPGCWINILPAGGLILIPEASSGCTCGYPIQTSMAFRPIPTS